MNSAERRRQTAGRRGCRSRRSSRPLSPPIVAAQGFLVVVSSRRDCRLPSLGKKPYGARPRLTPVSSEIEPQRPPLSNPLWMGPHHALYPRRFRRAVTPATIVGQVRANAY